MRLEHLEGGYSVCFESHTADADLADLFRGLPDDRCQLPRWGYVLEGRVSFRLRRPRGDIRGRRRLLRAAGPHAGPLRGGRDRRVQPHRRAGRDDRRGHGEPRGQHERRTRSPWATTAPTRRRRCGSGTRPSAAPGSARACASSTSRPAAARGHPGGAPRRPGARRPTCRRPCSSCSSGARADEGLSHRDPRAWTAMRSTLDDDSFDMAGSQFGVMLFPGHAQGHQRDGGWSGPAAGCS